MIDSELIKLLRANKASTPHAVATDLAKFNAIVSIDVEMGIVRLRRALDHIIRSIAQISDISPGTKPLEQILDNLRRNAVIPTVIMRHCSLIKDFGNLAAHGESAAECYSTEKGLSAVEAELCSRSMAVVVRWYLDKIAPQLELDGSYTIISVTDINDDMVRQTVEIDKLIYPDQFRGINEICLGWFKQNPHIYTMISDSSTGKIVGYINAMPLESEYYAKIESGSTIDLDIPVHAVRKYDLPDFYLLYFASIGLHPSYHCTSAFRVLYDAFIDRLVQLARQDIYITEMLADAVTPEGERLCRYAGMNKIRQTKHDSTIYKVCLLPPALRITTKTGKNLTAFYSKKFEEFKDLIPKSISANLNLYQSHSNS